MKPLIKKLPNHCKKKHVSVGRLDYQRIKKIVPDWHARLFKVSTFG